MKENKEKMVDGCKIISLIGFVVVFAAVFMIGTIVSMISQHGWRLL